MFYYYRPDIYYLVLIIPALIIALIAQLSVKSTYNKYKAVLLKNRMTGSEVARRILDANNLYHVNVELSNGVLSDHFDPKTDTIRLSRDVYYGESVSAAGIAAHESGHAIQYAQDYFPIKVRAAIIPLSRIGSNLSMPLILLGYIFSIGPLVLAGILLFSLVTVFQLVTLPVEVNASSRAVMVLGGGMLDSEELKGVRKVLTAAGWTYIAALLTSLAQLLRLVLIFGGRRKK